MVVGALFAAGASLTAGVIVMQVAILPLVFRYSKSVQRKIVFSTCFSYPRNTDYENPSSCDIIGGRNFYVSFPSEVDDCTIKLGAWHMIPRSLYHTVFVIEDCAQVDDRLYRELVTTENPVVLYCHGNANHRASMYRLQTYKVFQELNYHVISFDYRGYGDSTKVRPTEKGLVEDLHQMYVWLRKLVAKGEKTPMILLWGHSLGSAVAAHLVSKLQSSSQTYDEYNKPLAQPDALILEAPFNNLREEIVKHPCSKFVSWLPYYNNMFVKPFIKSSEYTFNTDEYLANVINVPILILHSKEDKIVPYDLAVKLHDTIKKSRGSNDAPVVIHLYPKGCHLGHNNICESNELPDVVGAFVDSLKEQRNLNRAVRRVKSQGITRLTSLPKLATPRDVATPVSNFGDLGVVYGEKPTVLADVSDEKGKAVKLTANLNKVNDILSKITGTSRSSEGKVCTDAKVDQVDNTAEVQIVKVGAKITQEIKPTKEVKKNVKLEKLDMEETINVSEFLDLEKSKLSRSFYY